MNINIITYTFFNSIQLLLNLLCFGFDSANCYNKEPVSLLVQYCTNNVSNLRVVYGQGTCI